MFDMETSFAPVLDKNNTEHALILKKEIEKLLSQSQNQKRDFDLTIKNLNQKMKETAKIVPNPFDQSSERVAFTKADVQNYSELMTESSNFK